MDSMFVSIAKIITLTLLWCTKCQHTILFWFYINLSIFSIININTFSKLHSTFILSISYIDLIKHIDVRVKLIFSEYIFIRKIFWLYFTIWVYCVDLDETIIILVVFFNIIDIGQFTDHVREINVNYSTVFGCMKEELGDFNII